MPSDARRGVPLQGARGPADVGGVKGPVEAGLRDPQFPAAGIDFHRRNGRGLTLTELRQLALDLRKRNEGYQQLYSQVAQGIADRFHNARRRFLEGSARRFPREKKPHRYYSLTYPQKGWRILSTSGKSGLGAEGTGRGSSR